MSAQIEPERVIHQAQPALEAVRTAKRPSPAARVIERLLLASRWLMAPLYAGLAFLLLLFVADFFVELAHLVEMLLAGELSKLALAALTLLDLVLVAGLIVMVMLSGFDSYVARIDLGDDRDDLARLTRMGTGSVKFKIVSSAAVISAINLLELVFTVDNFQQSRLLWILALHITLVATAVAFAVLDRLEQH